MKRVLVSFACAVAALAVCQQPVRGPQGGSGGPGRGGSSSFLLMMPDVQKEIGLSASQKEQITKVLQSGMMGPGGGTPPKGGQASPPRMDTGDFQQRIADMQKKLDTILKPAQKARLNEIFLQLQGPMALQQEDIAGKVGLSAKQKAAIRTIAEKARPNFSRPSQGAPKPADLEKLRKDMETKREAANKAIVATLTAGQKAKWAKMQGKPFKLTRSQMRMGGPGRPPSGGPPPKGGGI
jgi:hypothetical protein